MSQEHLLSQWVEGEQNEIHYQSCGLFLFFFPWETESEYKVRHCSKRESMTKEKHLEKMGNEKTRTNICCQQRNTSICSQDAAS